jgi:hypothetical protein
MGLQPFVVALLGAYLTFKNKWLYYQNFHGHSGEISILTSKFSVGAILFLLSCIASAQIHIILKQPPPNQLKIADLWNLTVTNTSNEDYRIFMEGSVSESKDGPIVEGTTPAFELKAHETKSFTPTNIGSAKVTWRNNKYKEIIIRTGGAPSGNYTICVFAKHETTGEELGRDCKEQNVELVSPPILTFPEDGGSVEQKYPTFTWLPPPGIMNPTYKLRIVEILGRQSVEEAMQRNSAFFENSDIRMPMLQYPLSGQEFQPEHKYAWKIAAFSDGIPLGESEIWWFTFMPSTPIRMLTRQEAIDIIINQVIVPPTLTHQVTAYLGMETVSPGSTIWPFKNYEKPITVSAPTWFGWVNDVPLAFFQHPTRYVLINALDGSYEVLNKNWWPVLNGESLWMSEEEKENPEVLIYSNLR